MRLSPLKALPWRRAAPVHRWSDYLELRCAGVAPVAMVTNPGLVNEINDNYSPIQQNYINYYTCIININTIIIVIIIFKYLNKYISKLYIWYIYSPTTTDLA